MRIALEESGGFDPWDGVALDEAHAPVAFLEVDFHELNGQGLDGLGADLAPAMARIESDLKGFEALRQPYLLYP